MANIIQKVSARQKKIAPEISLYLVCELCGAGGTFLYADLVCPVCGGKLLTAREILERIEKEF